VPDTVLTEGESLDHPQADRNGISLDIPQSSELELPLDPELFQPVDDLNTNWLPIDISKDFNYLQPMDPNISYDAAHQWWLESLNAKNEWLEPTTNVDHVPTLGLSEQPPSLPFATTQSPQSLSSLSQDGSSLSASNDEASGFGDHYVDGEGARHTKRKRRKTCWGPPEDPISPYVPGVVPRSKLAFPMVHEKLAHEICLNTFTRQIPSSTYEIILSMFGKLCCAQTLFTPFESTQFPVADILSYFICHYLDEFQSVYPVFHMPTFDLNQAHWILILTVSAIGSCFISSPDTAHYAYPLQEFARRAILVEKEAYKPGSVPIWLTQAMLLNCIGLIHSGDGQAKGLGLSSLSDLVRFAHQEKLLSNVESNINSSHSWKQWVEMEMVRRTGYFIWLLDSTLVYTETNFRPLFTLKDAQAPIPSHESLWDAGSEESWEALYHGENVSLYSATEVLFIEKRLVSDMGEFGHTLLLHALYHRLWEVSDYFQSPLTCWNPIATRQPREAAIPSSNSVWLPGVSMYSKWRNSACDCLDTLHWFANGTIAKAAGLEHSTVLHLHTARIVLLVPFQEIRSLATSLADAKIPWDNRLEQSPDWQHAWRWVRHDQFKARLAIIHAGSVLWYVRRYSTNAFHEPVAVFLATLTLWAYGLGIYDPFRTQLQTSPVTEVELEGSHPQQQPQAGTCEPDLTPTFIHLDRPCDDEIVQLFVREGQTMRGNVTGVGDICSPHGPSKVLKEGIRILSSLASTWGITHEYIDVLSRLGDRVSLPMQE
jgi:Fungal specific transcription factor domain